jgi:ribokinase
MGDSSSLLPQVVVVGSHAPGLFVRVHQTPRTGETVIGWDFQEPIDGGKGSNQAIAASRLGLRTSFVGCIGHDRLGKELKEWLQKERIDARHLYTSKEKGTGIGFIILDDEGVPAMVTSMGANEELNEKMVERAIRDFADARILLTQFEIRPEVALHAARVARQNGLLTIVNPAPALEFPLASLDVCDILIPNEIEAQKLLGDEDMTGDVESMARKLRTQSGAGCVIITLGSKGIVGVDSTGLWRIYPPAVNVIDTSGAGDLYCAALAAGIIYGKNYRAASEWACKVAALSVTRQGSIPSFPMLEEADKFFRETLGIEATQSDG